MFGTRNLVDACIAGNVRRLVATSSIAAIGIPVSGNGQEESNEQGTFDAWQRRNVYMESKHLAELECQRGVAEGLDVVFVNPGVVIGRGDGQHAPDSSSNEVLRLIYNGKLPFCPDGATGFADVRDVARAHIAAWEQGKPGERYIVVGENMAFRKLFDTIASIPGSSVKKTVRVSKTAGMAAGAAGELWSVLTGKPSFISIESIRAASRQIRYSNRKSVQELGMVYTPLVETLKTIFIT